MFFSVPKELAPLLLKDFLRRHNGVSLTSWRKIKHSGLIFVNGQSVNPHYLLQGGDTIAIEWPQISSIVPTPMELDIVHEDEHLLVVNKPAGLLVHPTVSQHSHTLANGVMHYYHQQGLSSSFHPVHRLDRNTSGLLLIAKQPYIQHLLARHDTKQLQRRYLALVQGHPSPEQGIIDAPIARHPDSIIQRMVHPAGQSAITHYRTLRHLGPASLLEVELETGRTHQIRVHMAHIGHPLLGDDLYGGSRLLIDRHALHATRMAFTHPVFQQLIIVDCPLPSDLAELSKTLVFP